LKRLLHRRSFTRIFPLLPILICLSWPELNRAEPLPMGPVELTQTDQKQADHKETQKGQEADKPQAVLTAAEAIAEYAIFAYGGRRQRELVRTAVQEEGTIRLATDQGDMNGAYTMRSIRREKSWQDLLRVDIELSPPGSTDARDPTVKYLIAFNGASVWSAQNGQYITPKPEVETAFRAQLTHDYTALLRYKEDGSKVELIGQETVDGIATHKLDLTAPNGEKTRFWISAKTYRVLHVEYELTLAEGQPPTKYKVSFYYTPYRITQNTLTPSRRKMYQDILIDSITCSAKLDPELFQHLP
jgi:hypothetical protein